MNHNSAGCLGALGLVALAIVCPLVHRSPIEQYLKDQSLTALKRDGLIGRPGQADWNVGADGLDVNLFGPGSEAARAKAAVERELTAQGLWFSTVKVLRPGGSALIVAKASPKTLASPKATVVPKATPAPEATASPAPAASATPGATPAPVATPVAESPSVPSGKVTGLVQILSHDGTTYVRGAYPDDASRKAAVQAAQSALGGAVKDETTLSGTGGALGWPEQVLKILSTLRPVRGLELSAGGDVLTVAGLVSSKAEREKLETAMKATLPAGVGLENQLTLVGGTRPIPEPSISATLPQEERQKAQSTINTVVGTGEVLFATASSRIKAEAYPYLNRIAEALKAQSGATVTVGGHTDNAGQETDNHRLSQKRADSVRAYLVAQGVPALHLFARGYGSSQPVASNATEEGRNRNRRIGFTVR